MTEPSKAGMFVTVDVDVAEELLENDICAKGSTTLKGGLTRVSTDPRFYLIFLVRGRSFLIALDGGAF